MAFKKHPPKKKLGTPSRPYRQSPQPRQGDMLSPPPPTAPRQHCTLPAIYSNPILSLHTTHTT